MRYLIREIIRQICDQLGIVITKGALSNNHIQILPKYSVSDVNALGERLELWRIQQEFPEVKKRFWGQRFWAWGYFCSTSGNVTNETVMDYIESHRPEPVDNHG